MDQTIAKLTVGVSTPAPNRASVQQRAAVSRACGEGRRTRHYGLKVGPQEWLTLMRALSMGLHDSSFTTFYNIARALLCKTENDYDLFDQVFAHYFKGVEIKAAALNEEILSWLKEAQGFLDLGAPRSWPPWSTSISKSS